MHLQNDMLTVPEKPGAQKSITHVPPIHEYRRRGDTLLSKILLPQALEP